MTVKEESMSIDFSSPLPPPHSGHGYTRICSGSLRRHAQKLPTLSGVADHMEFLGKEVTAWEARARTLHGLGLSLHDRCQELEALSAESRRLAADMIEDFSEQREELERDVARLSTSVQGLTTEVTSLSHELEEARQNAAHTLADKAKLVQEFASFRSFHESLVRDFDRAETKAASDLGRVNEALGEAERLVLSVSSEHDRDVELASFVITDLLRSLGETKVALEGAQASLRQREQEVLDFSVQLSALSHGHAAEIAEKNSKISSLEEGRASLEHCVSEMKASIQAVRAESDRAASEVLEMQTALDRQRVLIAERDGYITLLEEEVENQKRALLEAQNASSTISARAQQLESLHAEAQEKLAGMESVLARSSQHASDLQNKCIGLSVQSSSLLVQLEQEEERRALLEKSLLRMHGLEEALSGAWQEVQLLQVRNDELSDLRGDLEKELANANAQREAEKKRAETLEASSVQMSQELSENQAAYQQSQELLMTAAQREEEALTHLVMKDAKIQEVEQALFEARLEADTLRSDVRRLQDLDAQVSALHDLVQVQAQEIARLEAEKRAHAMTTVGFDDSVPWALRGWSGEDPCFDGVSGVQSWMKDCGLSVQSLSASHFPGYSSADREQLAMATGMRVLDFLELPFVRDCVKEQVRSHLLSGTSPSTVELEWVMVDGVPATRVNRLWRHLVAMTERPPQSSWQPFLQASQIGV